MVRRHGAWTGRLTLLLLWVTELSCLPWASIEALSWCRAKAPSLGVRGSVGSSVGAADAGCRVREQEVQWGVLMKVGLRGLRLWVGREARRAVRVLCFPNGDC